MKCLCQMFENPMLDNEQLASHPVEYPPPGCEGSMDGRRPAQLRLETAAAGAVVVSVAVANENVATDGVPVEVK
uniref:Uncharacterized protein n=1 Tax=Romanomermis culicivorax TaxID=13658 RepID=A0A915KRD8_ROMCU